MKYDTFVKYDLSRTKIAKIKLREEKLWWKERGDENNRYRKTCFKP
jgi:hypothetical protein